MITLALLFALQSGINTELSVAARWTPAFISDDRRIALFYDRTTFVPYAQYKTGWFLTKTSLGEETSFYTRADCRSRLLNQPTVIERQNGESDGKRTSYTIDMPVEPNTYNEVMFNVLCEQ